MDSLTQLTLGAAVGEAVLGRQVGHRAALWGALLGTLPDLDVLVPLGDAVRDFTYHRGASHSLFVPAALTPLVVWLILKIHPQIRPLRGRWAVLVYGRRLRCGTNRISRDRCGSLRSPHPTASSRPAR